MVAMDNEYLRRFEESLQAWTDERMVSREQIRDLAMFSLYLVNLAEGDGWTYDGHSWKESSSMGCLVVKARVANKPVVVFTSARTFVNAARIFLRKLEGGMLEWVVDKYRV